MSDTDKLALEIVDSTQRFKELEDCWNDLLLSFDQASPFLTWSWMYTWWDVYRTKDTKLNILVLSNAQKVVAIAPFYIRTTSTFPHLKHIYFLGTGEPDHMEVCSEYLDVITQDQFKQRVCRQILQYFSENINGWATIRLSRILINSVIYRDLVDEARKIGFSIKSDMCGYRYYIKLPNTWEKYYQTLSPRIKRSIKTNNKKINTVGKLEVKCVSDENEVNKEFERLAELHSARWKARGKSGAFTSSEFVQFHKKIAKMFLSKNELQLLYIKLNGKYLSILYNFCMNDVVYYYQSGFDLVQYKKLSPGVLAHTEAIKLAIDDKKYIYDFMMGQAESYKSAYGCNTATMFNIIIFNKLLTSKLIYLFHKLTN